MKVGIIVAMDKEMELLRTLIDQPVNVVNGPITFVEGKVGATQVVAMKCGIGKVNAAIGATMLIQHYHPDAVMNTGVAGAGDAAIAVGDVVVGERVAYHDVWCGPESEFNAVQGLPRYYHASELLLSKVPLDEHVHRGLICSGDWFVDTMQCAEAIKAAYPEVVAVDMESGSLAQTCHVFGVPFMSLRVISDSPLASKDNTADYTDFWFNAPQHTFDIVREVLSHV